MLCICAFLLLLFMYINHTDLLFMLNKTSDKRNIQKINKIKQIV